MVEGMGHGNRWDYYLMAKVRRVPQTARTVSKQSSGGSVRSTRQPSTIREMGDTDFPTLNSGK